VPKVLPEFAVGPVARAFRFAPDVYLWWDGELKEQLASPPYAYPRYSLRSLGAFLAVGRSAQADRGRSSDLQHLVVVSNGNDLAVSNAGVDRLADAVEGETTDRVDHVFAEDLGYRHDLIDPEGENAADLADIYAVLGPLLDLADLDKMTP
jgi:carboxylesterase